MVDDNQALTEISECIAKAVVIISDTFNLSSCESDRLIDVIYAELAIIADGRKESESGPK